MTSTMMLIQGVGLFLAMILATEVGFRIATRKGKSEGVVGAGVVEGAVFGLLGLLLAFAFSGAWGRFESRRGLVVLEANALSTAYSYVDLLAEEDQPALRSAFRKYVDSRILTYTNVGHLDAAYAEYGRGVAMREGIWDLAVAATGKPGREQARMLMLPNVNNAFDAATTRLAAAQAHLPGVIPILIAVVSLSCSTLAGYSMSAKGNRQWLRRLMLAGVTATTAYLVMDLEYPRAGLIRLSEVDVVMVDLRKSMGE